MNEILRKRKKGGGRKLADGRITKAYLIKSARNWFASNPSVSGFQNKIQISRQSYYRILNKCPWLKKELCELRNKVIFNRKESRRKMLLWLKKNPDKGIVDYFLKDISNTPVNLESVAQFSILINK